MDLIAVCICRLFTHRQGRYSCLVTTEYLHTLELSIRSTLRGFPHQHPQQHVTMSQTHNANHNEDSLAYLLLYCELRARSVSLLPLFLKNYTAACRETTCLRPANAQTRNAIWLILASLQLIVIIGLSRTSNQLSASLRATALLQHLLSIQIKHNPSPVPG